MRTFVIEPLRGIRGSVRFGMTREEARLALAPATADPFSRGGGPVDGFFDASVQVSYDAAGRVEFIEFGRDQGHSVCLDDFDLFSAHAVSVIEFLKQQFLKIEESEAGHSYCLPGVEIGLWRPVQPNENSDEGSYFESVGFDTAGYYGKKG
jgi:hypothetical protein